MRSIQVLQEVYTFKQIMLIIIVPLFFNPLRPRNASENMRAEHAIRMGVRAYYSPKMFFSSYSYSKCLKKSSKLRLIFHLNIIKHFNLYAALRVT